MSDQKWSVEIAIEWYQSQPWLRGCNFIPSTAINQLEMWQAETFDLDTIARELGWAANLGLNAIQIFEPLAQFEAVFALLPNLQSFSQSVPVYGASLQV